ncbi:MAG: glycosyltransferase family 2 protein [Pseudomonadota bacterium]
MTASLSVIFALGIFLTVAGISLNVALGRRKIAELGDIVIKGTGTESRPASVSIIVSACNEEKTIEPALRSLLQINYPNLEIIAINDRSTDDTAKILDQLGLNFPALRVIHIDTLPGGWLGKNHALACGADQARGEYIIFTDADAVFSPDAVSRAVTYCQTRQVDHLALLFDVIAPTRLLQMLIISFVTGFMAKFQPWKVNRSARHFIGIGGFNMVRTTAYKLTGGHRAMPMAVLDDLTLGQMMKTFGHAQHVLMGTGMITIEWYPNTVGLCRGMEKNIFAAFNYNLTYLASVTIIAAGVRIWPWIALFLVQGAAWWLYAATIASSLALAADLLRARRWPLSNLLMAPLISILELLIWWRGCLLTYYRGGIIWRDTFYSLQEIRCAHRALQRSFADKMVHGSK